ncbi:MAG: bacillithiol biosynthesis deacetylase BshB1 [Cyclobacteriaceae bacterium]
MKLDILAIGAHPDDVELSCAGTLMMHQRTGKKVGVVDLTEGEMGTRGTVEDRRSEAAAAARIMKLSARENLGFRDAFFINDEEHQLKVIQAIRKYQPEIILANATYDRHPDHGRAAALVEQAVFKSGLAKIETHDDENMLQSSWRPKKLYHYVQSVTQEPDFFVDISEAVEDKFAAISAYKSQFYQAGDDGPQTYISKPDFMEMIEARTREWGHRIGVKHAEGFTQKQFLGVKSLYDLI